MSSGGDFIQLKDLKPGLKNINIVIIVLEVGPPTLTKEQREVRTLRVADQTASANLSVWDEPGALLQPGDIVRITRGYAALWRGALTLYSGKNGDIQKIGEFCMLFNEQLNMSEPQTSTPPPTPASHASPNNALQSNGNTNTARSSLASHAAKPSASDRYGGAASAPKTYVRGRGHHRASARR
ncbi:SOSS complex subunit B homolog [Eumeta japonica]|uniref:SOSS complex subunit B homolog n=1 Tax=Eumeta variegata TaxID=151549 RepID=A0A4C1VBT0_EUMVA|nr:SOSS complex subunit B homolog [Eumeta japonica]